MAETPYRAEVLLPSTWLILYQDEPETPSPAQIRTGVETVLKDERYLNPRIRPDRPLIPVWWFLQGLNKSARHKFEAMRFRVVDFTRDPFAGEIEQAFATHLPSGLQPVADISMRSKRSGTPKNIP